MDVTGRLRIAFFGTPAFAVPTLEALLASRHPVVAVVTQPDRPRGRGQKPSFSPVKDVAVAAGLPLLQPEKLRDAQFLAAFAAVRADLGVVAAYGKIIPDTLIAVPPHGMINVHASLLPRYRGAAPIQRAVLAGDTVTGITIMRIVRELDAGGMFAKVERPILPDATSRDVEHDLAQAGAQLLVEVVDAIANGTAREVPQDDAAVTYAPKLTREEGLIDWSRPAASIHNQIRGLVPWPHAWTHLDGQRVIITKSAPETGDEPGTPGQVVEAHGDVIRVRAGTGVVRILALQPEGKRVMTPREFLSGRPVPPGTRLV
jgi:methionyl-tRNA formyltransferase